MKSAEEFAKEIAEWVQGGSPLDDVAEKHLALAITARDAEHAQERERLEVQLAGCGVAAQVILQAGNNPALLAEALISHIRARDAEHAQERERLEVQLAGCGVAAQGWSKGEQRAERGDYGWSPSYQDVLELRERWEQAAEREQAAVAAAFPKREALAKVLFELESRPGNAQWPEDWTRQPYCQWALRDADQILATFITPAHESALDKMLELARQEGWQSCLRNIRSSVAVYPNQGGDIEVMTDIDKLIAKARREGAKEMRERIAQHPLVTCYGATEDAIRALPLDAPSEEK